MTNHSENTSYQTTRGFLAGMGQIGGIIMVFLGLYSLWNSSDCVRYKILGNFIFLIVFSIFISFKYHIGSCFNNVYIHIMKLIGTIDSENSHSSPTSFVQIDDKKVNKFIYLVGIVDVGILTCLVVATGGLAKSVYSPIFLVIPSAVLIITKKSFNDFKYIFIATFIGIFFSWISYAWLTLLKYLPHGKTILEFWDQDKNGHNTCIFSIILISSFVILLDAFIKIWNNRQSR